MSLISESHDSLPYIDAPISDVDRRQAEALISREVPADYARKLHSSLPLLAETKFSPMILKEIERVGSGGPREGGIDLSRYEAPDEPAQDSDVDSWRNALRAAYTSTTYLAGRQVNLSLLEELGKNAWLISNSQLDQILKSYEARLEQLKAETEEVNKMRKSAQEGSKGEMMALEDTWKKGVGKIIEIQVATNGLRRDLLERQREQHG